MGDFSDFYLNDDGECPQCSTAAIYQIGENNYMCKCTYEFETGGQNEL